MSMGILQIPYFGSKCPLPCSYHEYEVGVVQALTFSEDEEARCGGDICPAGFSILFFEFSTMTTEIYKVPTSYGLVFEEN